MKDLDYKKLIELVYVGGGWIPHNENATELSEQSAKGEIQAYKNVTGRDLNMHRCYFSLLNFIWGYLPGNFQERIGKSIFYLWLKHLKKEYKVIYSFIDFDKIETIIDYCLSIGVDSERASSIAAKFGKTDLIEYDSISFGNMNQQKFKEYVKEQLPYIYENVLGKFFEGDILTGITETIENEYEKFFSKL